MSLFCSFSPVLGSQNVLFLLLFSCSGRLGRALSPRYSLFWEARTGSFSSNSETGGSQGSWDSPPTVKRVVLREARTVRQQ